MSMNPLLMAEAAAIAYAAVQSVRSPAKELWRILCGITVAGALLLLMSRGHIALFALGAMLSMVGLALIAIQFLKGAGARRE